MNFGVSPYLCGRFAGMELVMKISGLKNIIIIILLITNAFLLCLVVPSIIKQERQRQETLNDIQSLIFKAGITLETEIPDNDTLQVLNTYYDLEKAGQAAAVLISQPALTADSDFSRSYSGIGGTADFSKSGDFLYTLDGSTEAVDNTQGNASSILKKLGYNTTEFRIVTSGDSKTITAYQKLGEVPVFDCIVTFNYEKSVLQTVYGHLLNGTVTAAKTESASVNAETAIIKFLGESKSNGWIFTSIIGIEAGYNEDSTTASYISLAPVWRITTDTGVYDVNAIDCTVKPVTDQ